MLMPVPTDETGTDWGAIFHTFGQYLMNAITMFV